MGQQRSGPPEEVALAPVDGPSRDSMLVLVCTYNERLNLPEVFAGIDAVLPGVAILVVDDGSPDGTAVWVREQTPLRPNTFLIERAGKLGLGTAIRAGMEFAMQHQYRWVLNLDADMSHDPAAIPQLLAKASDNDLVIGSRYVDGGGFKNCSAKRIFVSKAANAYARWVVGWKVRDCSSAYRLYRVKSLEPLPWSEIRGTGYGFLEEVLWHLIHMGNRWSEVGIVYTERKKGRSKISLGEVLSTVGSLHRVAALRHRKTSKP